MSDQEPIDEPRPPPPPTDRVEVGDPRESLEEVLAEEERSAIAAAEEKLTRPRKTSPT